METIKPNVCIFHGTGGTPDLFWIPYLKTELEKLGYEVWAPQMPEAEEPDVNVWVPYVFNNKKFNSETILIGHSAGATLILSLLEKADTPIKKAILVSGFYQYDKPFPILQESYNWEKIKNNCKQFVFMNSDDDPYQCGDVQGRGMFDKLGGIQIILHGQGHMGSNKYNQPYKEFPLLLKLCEEF